MDIFIRRKKRIREEDDENAPKKKRSVPNNSFNLSSIKNLHNAIIICRNSFGITQNLFSPKTVLHAKEYLQRRFVWYNVPDRF